MAAPSAAPAPAATAPRSFNKFTPFRVPAKEKPTETPVAKTPVAKTPVAETPVVKTPVAETQKKARPDIIFAAKEPPKQSRLRVNGPKPAEAKMPSKVRPEAQTAAPPAPARAAAPARGAAPQHASYEYKAPAHEEFTAPAPTPEPAPVASKSTFIRAGGAAAAGSPPGRSRLGGSRSRDLAQKQMRDDIIRYREEQEARYTERVQEQEARYAERVQYREGRPATPPTPAPEEMPYQEHWNVAPAEHAEPMEPVAPEAPTHWNVAPAEPAAPAPKRQPGIIIAGQKKPAPQRGARQQLVDSYRDYFNPPQFQGQRVAPRAPPMSKRAMETGSFQTKSTVRAVVYHRGERVGEGGVYTETDYSEYSP